jgi:hypothetical protein
VDDYWALPGADRGVAVRASCRTSGPVVLLRTAETVGLLSALTESVRPWQRRLARASPAQVLLDLAVALALGRNCLADMAPMLAVPEVRVGRLQTDVSR